MPEKPKTIKRIATRNEKSPWVELWPGDVKLEKIGGVWGQKDEKDETDKERNKIKSFLVPDFNRFFGHAIRKGRKRVILIA